MARYIDADALKTVKSIQMGNFNSIETIQEWIDNAPTADVKPVARGEWIITAVEEVGIFKIRTKKCSHCSKRAIDGISCEGATMDIINDFCPNCGADMRGEKWEKS